jgi:DNA-directed RNA polymerase subunit M/transcription elongation factor TFIIS
MMALSTQKFDTYKALSSKSSMEFCDLCDNLLYLRGEEEGGLARHCKHCGVSKPVDGAGPAWKVCQTLYSEDDLLYLQYKNKYLRYDPTLPRVSDPSLPCPNKECTGPKDKPQVVYIKYHPLHMKYMYTCDYCGTQWRSQDHK